MGILAEPAGSQLKQGKNSVTSISQKYKWGQVKRHRSQLEGLPKGEICDYLSNKIMIVIYNNKSIIF